MYFEFSYTLDPVQAFSRLPMGHYDSIVNCLKHALPQSSTIKLIPLAFPTTVDTVSQDSHVEIVV